MIPEREEIEALVRWTIRLVLVLAKLRGQMQQKDDLVDCGLYALGDALRRYDHARIPQGASPETRLAMVKGFVRKRIVGELLDEMKRYRERAAWEVSLEDLADAEEAGNDAPAAARAAVAGFVTWCAAGQLHLDAEAQYLRHEAVAGLRREVAELPPNAQRLLDLRHLQGLTWDDVAAALGIPARTARDHDKKLREQLEEALLTGERPPPSGRFPRSRRP